MYQTCPEAWQDRGMNTLLEGSIHSSSRKYLLTLLCALTASRAIRECPIHQGAVVLSCVCVHMCVFMCVVVGRGVCVCVFVSHL